MGRQFYQTNIFRIAGFVQAFLAIVFLNASVAAAMQPGRLNINTENTPSGVTLVASEFSSSREFQTRRVQKKVYKHKYKRTHKRKYEGRARHDDYPRRKKRHRRKKTGLGLVLTLPSIDLDEKPRRRVRKRPPPPKKKTTRRRRAIPAVKIADKRHRKNEVVVILKGAKSLRSARAIAKRYNLQMLKGYNLSLVNARVQSYRIRGRRSVGSVLARLKRDKRIKASQPNYVYSLTEGNKQGDKAEAQDDNGRFTQYSHSSMRIGKAHDIALGRNIRIAVIDTGIDRTHPAFRDAVITPFNAVREKKTYKGHKHGTAIAGVLAAQHQITGIAPKAHLLDARAFFVSRKTGKPETTTMILLRALQWSYDQKAQIFNLSFEGPKDPVIADAIEVLYEKGSVLVAAAGNGGPKAKPAYPAAYTHVIAITAIDKKNKIYRHANRGKYLSVSAPGVKVMVVAPSKAYDFSTGTSIAAAHISGLAALMMESKPRLSSQDIRKIIVQNAQDLGKPGHDTSYGAGLADAYSSVTALEKYTVSRRN